MKQKLNLTLDMRVAGPRPEGESYKLADPAVLQQDITPAQRKLGAAFWLLDQLRLCLQNESACLTFAELLVATARSTTFALQKQFRACDGFNEWYSERQAEMKMDEDLKALVGLRNTAEKEGFIFAKFAHRIIHRTYADGSFIAELGPPELEIEDHESVAFLTSITSALATLKLLIDDAHQKFGTGRLPRKREMILEFVRESLDGWEHYDLESPPEMSIKRPKRPPRA